MQIKGIDNRDKTSSQGAIAAALQGFRAAHPRCAQVAVVLLFALPMMFAAAFPAMAQDEAKKLVALLDYLGTDYKNAVQDGKVLSKDEYGEAQEFAKRSLELFRQLKAADKGDKAGVESELNLLAQQIGSKADPKVVAESAKSAKDKVIAAYKIVPYPRRLPSLARSRRISGCCRSPKNSLWLARRWAT